MEERRDIKPGSRAFTIESLIGKCNDDDDMDGVSDGIGIWAGASAHTPGPPYLPLPFLYNSWPVFSPLLHLPPADLLSYLPRPPQLSPRSLQTAALSDDSRSESRSPLTPHDLTTKSPKGRTDGETSGVESGGEGDTEGVSKTRRRRTAFTSEQLLELEREFHAKKYLSLTERSQIASALKLSEVQVPFRCKFMFLLPLTLTAGLLCFYLHYCVPSNAKKTEFPVLNLKRLNVVPVIDCSIYENCETMDNSSNPILTEMIFQKGYKIPNIEFCPEMGQSLKVLVGIHSAACHNVERRAIRRTWGHYALQKNVAIAFFVGISKNESVNNIINEESALYGDIIKGNYMDCYNNLSLKTISFLDWIDRYCSKAPFIFKTDDDVFVNFPNLLSFINRKSNVQNTIFGQVAHNWTPVRVTKSKYFVSTNQYSKSVYPDFTVGSAYLFTRDIVSKMYTTALKTIYLKLEDVFITGIVAESLNIKRVSVTDFLLNRKMKKIETCKIMKNSISFHYVTFDQQHELWNEQSLNNYNCK